MKRVLATAIGLMMVLAGGACAPRVSTRLSPAALDLVTAAHDYPARQRILDLAEEDLVARCMHAAGQVYWPITPKPFVESDEDRVIDLATRRTHGYWLAEGGATPPKVGPDERAPAFQSALFGDQARNQSLPLPGGAVTMFPADGCLAESRAALYGDVQRWARADAVPQILANALRSQVKDASSLAEARALWKECMGAAGFGYADPEAAKRDLTTAYARHGKTPALRQREIAVATADGQCARQTHLYAVELQLRIAAASTLPADQIRELNDLAVVHCAAYLKAQTVIGAHPSASACPTDG